MKKFHYLKILHLLKMMVADCVSLPEDVTELTTVERMINPPRALAYFILSFKVNKLTNVG